MAQQFTLTTGNLRVSYRFEQDRFSHDISLQKQGEWMTSLASCESESTENWPASPPLQEIHEHEPGRSLLAVGGAGTSHWSACVEIVTERKIRFDFACRLSQKYDFLGSNYRLPSGLDHIQRHDRTASIDGLEIKALDSAELTVVSPTITVSPNVNEIQLPTTIRWKYEVISAQS